MGRFVFSNCSTSDDLLVQQRCGWTGAKGRLRREDCRYVKHDKLFSKWKILMGPLDSTEQINSASRKDGSCKYHTHNLPAAQFGPGVYELGVTAPSWSQVPNSKRSRTLKTEDVIPVYIGQAANIRQRLQKYGQAGAQLEHGSRPSTPHHGDNDSVKGRSPRMVQSGFRGELPNSTGSGPRLFSEVFALGSSIAFRWAHTDSKVVAEQVESELLAVFDYAWNKGTSGTRRSRDILAKLFMAWPSKNTSFRSLIFSGKRSPWLFLGRTNAVGIKVALRKPQDTTTSTFSSRNIMRCNLCFLTTVQPKRRSITMASLDVRCGAATARGMPCNAPPLRGRKRCLQHYETKPLRGLIPSSASLNPSASTTKKFNMGSMKLQSAPVETTCFLQRGFLGRELLFQTKTKTQRKEVDAREEKPVERRRHNSLSFNTWVKGETDQRVHDSSNMKESTKGTSFQEPLLRQGSGMRSNSSKRRVQHLGSKYASVCDNDSKTR
ncbi:hypothetical protein M758_4G233700 [Ceratodon purpureus]|nr:hypothetical protein M758_4G233700 [Ceratodon purpureus]